MATIKQGLMKEDLAAVQPKGPVSEASFAAALTAIGATKKTLILWPGVWPITVNRTVPINVEELYMVPGAQFNISAGVTLTINSPRVTIQGTLPFLGAGNVVLGNLNPIPAHWLASAGDGSSGSPWTGWGPRLSLQPAGRQFEVWPGVHRLTAAAAIPVRSRFVGAGRDTSIIQVQGNIRGLFYEPAVQTDAHITLEHLAIEGSSNAVGGTLELLSFKNASFLTIEQCALRTTSTQALKVWGATQVRIHDCDIEHTRDAGIYFLGPGSVIGVVNGTSIRENWFEHGLGAAIRLNATDNCTMEDNVFEGLDGGTNADTALWIEGGGSDIYFGRNYTELYATWNIVVDGLTRTLRIIQNELHSSSNFKIQLRGKVGQAAAHEETQIMFNKFHGANSPSGTTKYINLSENQVSAYIDFNWQHPDDVANAPVWILHGSIGSTEHRAYLYPTGDPPVWTRGIALGEKTYLLEKTGHVITVHAPDSDAEFRARVAGGDRLVVKQANTEITNGLFHQGAAVGLFNTTPIAKQTVTGSRGGNAALADLLTKLAAYGLIVDSTT